MDASLMRPAARAALMAGALALACAAGQPAATEAYNVLLLMTDEHTPRVLGCYGDALVKTPTLDALAANQKGKAAKQ